MRDASVIFLLRLFPHLIPPFHTISAFAWGRSHSSGSVYGSLPVYTRITSAGRLSLFKVVAVLQSLYIVDLPRFYRISCGEYCVLGRALSPVTNGSLGSLSRWFGQPVSYQKLRACLPRRPIFSVRVPRHLLDTVTKLFLSPALAFIQGPTSYFDEEMGLPSQPWVSMPDRLVLPRHSKGQKTTTAQKYGSIDPKEGQPRALTRSLAKSVLSASLSLNLSVSPPFGTTFLTVSALSCPCLCLIQAKHLIRPHFTWL